MQRIVGGMADEFVGAVMAAEVIGCGSFAPASSLDGSKTPSDVVISSSTETSSADTNSSEAIEFTCGNRRLNCM